jgi:hypothetical protein
VPDRGRLAPKNWHALELRCSPEVPEGDPRSGQWWWIEWSLTNPHEATVPSSGLGRLLSFSFCAYGKIVRPKLSNANDLFEDFGIFLFDFNGAHIGFSPVN